VDCSGVPEAVVEDLPQLLCNGREVGRDDDVLCDAQLLQLLVIFACFGIVSGFICLAG
jgi:hypothetical protein